MTEPPRRIETSLLVVESFRDDDGTEWAAGDRAPTGRRAVRRVALAHPERFAMEHETSEVDVAWLKTLDADFEREYVKAKARRDQAKEQQQQALRRELREQDRSQPELERRFAKQEAERKDQAQARRDAAERQRIEDELELGRERERILMTGFHTSD